MVVVFESDYSVCPRPFLRPVQDLVWDRDGTGQGRDWDAGTRRDGELDNMYFKIILLCQAARASKTSFLYADKKSTVSDSQLCS